MSSGIRKNPINNTSSVQHPAGATERKREQNRIAQRTYRRNQKLRVQALEKAAARSRRSDATLGEQSLAVGSVLDDLSNEEPWDNICIDQGGFQETSNSIEPPELVFEDSLGQNQSHVSDSGVLATQLTNPALHRAVCHGNMSICRLLIEMGAQVDKRDANGKTALHIAVEKQDEQIVRFMLGHSNVNLEDGLGRTVLFTAVERESEPMVQLLLDHKIDVNAIDMVGEMAIHQAVDSGNEAIVELLVRSGADVNV